MTLGKIGGIVRAPLHRATNLWAFLKWRTYLSRGRDANAADARGVVPLQSAARRDSPALAKLLIAHGASVTVVDEDAGSALAGAAKFGHRRVAGLLLDRGADPNDASGPLHCAISNGHTELAELLLARGADANGRDSHGNTPVHALAEGGPSWGETAELLLSAGADVKVVNKQGQTPLHLALADFYIQPDVAVWLIEKGVDVNARDRSGRTALDYVNEWSDGSDEHMLVAKILHSLGAKTGSGESSGQ